MNEEEETDPAAVVHSKCNTMASRYLHRAVPHFYQRIGKKAASAFAAYTKDVEGRGAQGRMRGTQTRLEVVLSPEQARTMLETDSFITETVTHTALLCALATAFSSFGVLHRFTEAGPTRGGARVPTFRPGQMKVVHMKVREHLKMRSVVQDEKENDKAALAASAAASAARAAAHAAGASPAEELAASRAACDAETFSAPAAAVLTPERSSCHRAERVQKLTTMNFALSVQGGD